MGRRATEPRIAKGVRIVCSLLAACSLCFAALFGWAFYEFYWRWRDCFNELGRCYDPVSQDVYLEQAGMVWVGLAAMSLLAGFGLVMGLRRRPG